MKRPTLVMVNNFKEKIKTPPTKPKPKEDFWYKFDRIIHQILF